MNVLIFEIVFEGEHHTISLALFSWKNKDVDTKNTQEHTFSDTRKTRKSQSVISYLKLL
jgi:hypothetical protein